MCQSYPVFALQICKNFRFLSIFPLNIFVLFYRFPAAVHLLKSGHAPMKHIIARTFAWEHIEKAFSEALEIANMGVWRVCLNERCG